MQMEWVIQDYTRKTVAKGSRARWQVKSTQKVLSKSKHSHIPKENIK